MLTYYIPALLLSISRVGAELSGPVINLGYASYLGNDTLPGVHFFGGLPYAKPPVGDLRFRPPVPVDEHKAQNYQTDSRNWGAMCVQQPAVVGIGSEGIVSMNTASTRKTNTLADCLTLNVWKPPQADKTSKLPVFLYIHVCTDSITIGTRSSHG